MDYQPFGPSENVRWFCVFQDVEELLKRLNLYILSNIDEYNYQEFKKLSEEFEEKTKKRKEDWRGKFQKIINSSMIDGYI